MAAWGLIKDLSLDLSGFSNTQVQKLIDNMDSGEIQDILKELAIEREKNKERNQVIDLAISIAEFVLTKGTSLI